MGEQILNFFASSWKWIATFIEFICIVCFTIPKIRNKIKDSLQNFIGLKDLKVEIQSMKESPVPPEKQIYSGWVKTYLSFCHEG